MATDPAVLEDWVAQAPREFIQCRSGEHHWELTGFWPPSANQPDIFIMVKECSVCGRERETEYSAITRIPLHTTYRHSDPAYRIRGAGHLNAADHGVIRSKYFDQLVAEMAGKKRNA